MIRDSWAFPSLLCIDKTVHIHTHSPASKNRIVNKYATKIIWAISVIRRDITRYTIDTRYTIATRTGNRCKCDNTVYYYPPQFYFSELEIYNMSGVV